MSRGTGDQAARPTMSWEKSVLTKQYLLKYNESYKEHNKESGRLSYVPTDKTKRHNKESGRPSYVQTDKTKKYIIRSRETKLRHNR